MNAMVNVMAGGWAKVVQMPLCGEALARVTVCATVPAKWEVVLIDITREVIWTFITRGHPEDELPPEMEELAAGLPEEQILLPSAVWEPAEPYRWGGQVIIEVHGTNLHDHYSCDFYATVEGREPTPDELMRFSR